jgi:hypothetical protein
MPQKYVTLYFYVRVGLQKFTNSFTTNFQSFKNFNDKMKLLHCLGMFMNISYLLNLL